MERMERTSLLLDDDLKYEPYNPHVVDIGEPTYLGKFTKFFLTQRDHFFSSATEIRNQLIQLLAAGTSWGVFFGSAQKYADSQSKVEGALYIGCTTVAATIFTYVVSDEFFTKHQNRVGRKLKKITAEETMSSEEEIPELRSNFARDIKQIIKVPTPAERRRTTAYITAGACGASWPFTFVGLQYSAIKALWFLILYGFVLQLDNTVLHFLAIYLAFNHKGYGFLRSGWNSLKRWISLLTIKDVRLLTTRLLAEQQAADCAELMDILAGKLTQTRQHLIEQCLAEENGEINTDVFNFDQSTRSGLEDLLSLIAMNPDHALAPASKDSYIDKAVHVVGALETDLSYLGYMVGLFKSVLDTSAKWKIGLQIPFVFIAGVVPNYFFVTLMSYVGGGAAERFVNYVVDCFKHRKISLASEIRLNLKAFCVYAVFAAPTTWYSPGSAPQINLDNLPEPYASPLAINSQYGVRFLIAIIFVDFFIVAARKIMIYGKNSETRDFCRFLQCYDYAIENLKSFDPTLLEEDVQAITPQQNKILFGMEKPALDEKLDHKTNLLSKLEKEIKSSYLPAGLYGTLFPYQSRVKNQLEGGLEPSLTGSGSQVSLLSSIQFRANG